MSTATVTLRGQRFVLLPEKEYRRLRLLADQQQMPSLPPKDAKGTYPAVEAVRVTIARTLIRRRRAAGLSQAELAERAGVRPETISRIEHGKHTPSLSTMQRIEGALSEIERNGV